MHCESVQPRHSLMPFTTLPCLVDVEQSADFRPHISIHFADTMRNISDRRSNLNDDLFHDNPRDGCSLLVVSRKRLCRFSERIDTRHYVDRSSSRPAMWPCQVCLQQLLQRLKLSTKIKCFQCEFSVVHCINKIVTGCRLKCTSWQTRTSDTTIKRRMYWCSAANNQSP